MENNQQPHITVFGEEVGKNPEVEPQGKRCERRCPCGRYGRCRCCGGGFGGLIVILVGILLLLNNYGVVSWGIWNAMAMFWPALLVVIGLKIILGRNIVSRIITSLIALVLVLFILLVGLVRVGSPLVGQMHLPAEIMNVINQVK